MINCLHFMTSYNQFIALCDWKIQRTLSGSMIALTDQATNSGFHQDLFSCFSYNPHNVYMFAFMHYCILNKLHRFALLFLRNFKITTLRIFAVHLRDCFSGNFFTCSDQSFHDWSITRRLFCFCTKTKDGLCLPGCTFLSGCIYFIEKFGALFVHFFATCCRFIVI